MKTSRGVLPLPEYGGKYMYMYEDKKKKLYAIPNEPFFFFFLFGGMWQLAVSAGSIGKENESVVHNQFLEREERERDASETAILFIHGIPKDRLLEPS